MPATRKNGEEARYRVVDIEWRRNYYLGPSLYAAARVAHKKAQRGRPVYLRRDDDDTFTTRRYRPDMAANRRWWYEERCPCGKGWRYPGAAQCRSCWRPSAAHVAQARKNFGIG